MKTPAPALIIDLPPQLPARDIDIEATLADGSTRRIPVRASTSALGLYLAAHRMHLDAATRDAITSLRVLP